MVRKKIKEDAPALFPVLVAPTPTMPRPAALPAHARPLFLPDVVEQVAQRKHLDLDRLDAAHAVFCKWVADIRAAQFAGQNELQRESDFGKELLKSLSYRPASKIPTGASWSLQIKDFSPGSGTPDMALG